MSQRLTAAKHQRGRFPEKPAWRTLLMCIAVGVALALVLVVSRELLAGRVIPFWLENTAGIWFVAAFAAGALVRRPVSGALAGAGSLLLALFLYESVSFATVAGFAVQLIPRLNPIWILISAVTGAGVGALAGWSAGGKGQWWLGLAVIGALLAGESAALFVGGPPHPSFSSGIGVVQASIGAGVVLLGVRGGRRLGAFGLFALLTALIVVLEIATGLITRLVWG